MTPKREIPINTKLNCIFGGSLNTFGWSWLFASLAFTSFFVWDVDFKNLNAFDGPLDQEQAVITLREATNATINHERVMRNDYEFYFNGEKIQGTSYATGWSHPEGKQVRVEFPINKPEVSRIKGMRRNTFGVFIWLFLLFPFVGVLTILFGLKSGLKNLKLLNIGQIGLAKIKNLERTNTSINDKRVMLVTMNLRTMEGPEHEIQIKTHRVEKLDDDYEEKVLYDPMNPQNAVAVDLIAGKIKFNELGQIQDSGNFPANIVTAGFCIAGIMGFIFYKL